MGQIWCWRGLGCNRAKRQRPAILVINEISRTFRRALTGNKLDSPIESGVTITVNTPESGQPPIDIRSGSRPLGNLAIGLFRDFAEAAGLLRAASLRQRIGRAFLRRVEPMIASLEKLTVRNGQSNIGPYDF